MATEERVAALHLKRGCTLHSKQCRAGHSSDNRKLVKADKDVRAEDEEDVL